ncbi:adenosine kinase [Bacteriovorax sp. DB6_IX]|uniref:adenosine kinase n=1 Tax=Bacteriovorax sp. DB6_IX TaxID=1353530 RepID=UPI00038A3DEF|nr:adenosine kinase [Bacteriovorax sp. DB6_IX]EQC49827.1 carbohydrate kinase, PfkB family [Bacteriovorax sp. DB6_IX]
MTQKYHVYGIGNALVDMEFEVSTDFLNENSVEKGLMTLVEEERQDELLDKLGGHHHKRSCGGSAANTIIATSQLGANSFYSCKVASDETGDFYWSDLKAKGVHSNLSSGRFEGVTGKCMVFVTPDADRTMNTYLGITATFSKEQIIDEELLQSEWVYLEGYLVTGESGKAAAIHARELAQANNKKVALTFSDPGIVSFFKEGFKEIIGDKKLDLLFCNHEEAMSYTGTHNVEEAYNALKEVAKTFAITLGPKGALIFDGQDKIYVVGNKVEAVDTNGAGDLFAGSFLYAITHGYSYGEAGHFACNCASKLVTQFGARLETEEILEIKKEVLGE